MNKALLALAAMVVAASSFAQTSRSEWYDWRGGAYRSVEPVYIPRAGDEAPTSASRYFEQGARGGVLNREQAARYWSNRLDGAALDFEALDVDGDGVASQAEWLTYHRGQGASAAPGQ